MIDKTIIQNNSWVLEAEELEKIYNQFLVKRKETTKNTRFKVESILFGDVISKDTIPTEPITKFTTLLAKTM